jgi:hypothetical protein
MPPVHYIAFLFMFVMFGPLMGPSYQGEVQQVRMEDCPRMKNEFLAAVQKNAEDLGVVSATASCLIVQVPTIDPKEESSNP